MEKLAIASRCTREEYMAYRVACVKTPWLTVACGGAGLLCSAVTVLANDGFTSLTMLLVCTSVVLLCMPLLLNLWHRGEAGRHYDNADSLKEAITLTVTREQVTVRTACHEGTLPLSYLTAVRETSGAFGLCFGAELELCIPKRSLSDAERVFLKSCMQTMKKEREA